MFQLSRTRSAVLSRTRVMSKSKAMHSSVQNATRPKDWKAAAPSAPVGTKTFKQDAQLQPLPIPQVLDTFNRLSESLLPLARNQEEFSAARAKILAFANGSAHKLQARLEERQAATQNWLEEWWDDGMFSTPFENDVSDICR
jgi:carnitine O-acetyltransferase